MLSHIHVACEFYEKTVEFQAGIKWKQSLETKPLHRCSECSLESIAVTSDLFHSAPPRARSKRCHCNIFIALVNRPEYCLLETCLEIHGCLSAFNFHFENWKMMKTCSKRYLSSGLLNFHLWVSSLSKQNQKFLITLFTTLKQLWYWVLKRTLHYYFLNYIKCCMFNILMCTYFSPNAWWVCMSVYMRVYRYIQCARIG